MSDASVFLGVVNRNSELLNQIWMRDTDHVTPEIEGKIAELRRHRLVMVDAEGNIRLSRSTREFLAMGAGSSDNFRGKQNIIQDVEHLTQLAEYLEVSARNGAGTDVDNFEMEAIELIWLISDTLDGVVADFESILKNGLGQTGTRELRLTRGKHYSSRIRDLSASIMKIVSRDVLNRLAAPSCSAIHRLYQTMICDRIGPLIMRIKIADEGITRLIMHDREVLLRTRRMRLQLELLRRYGEKRRIDALMNLDPETMFMPASPGAVALPDPCDEDLHRVREELAAKMPPRRDRIVTVRGNSEPIAPIDLEEAGSELIAPEYLLADAFRGHLDETGAPHSLRAWLSERPETDRTPAAFETIMFGILNEPGGFEVEFVPPLEGKSAMRVNDIVVRAI